MMKSSLIRINLIYILLVLFIPNLVSAETKTFIKEYTYQASELDSKVSCRVIALEQVKRLLLEELGTYLESYTEVKNYQLTSDKIVTLTAGIVSTKILTESYDGKAYVLKAELKADPDNVTQSVRNYKNDWDKTRELEELRKKSDDLVAIVDQLRKKLLSYEGNRDIASQYEKAVVSLSALDWIHKGYALFENKKYRDAIDAYNRAIELDPVNAIAYNDRGLARQYIGDYVKSLKDFDTALELTTNKQFKSFILSNRAIPNIRLGNYAQALSDCNEAIDLNLHNYWAYNNRGMMNRGLMHAQLALNDFDKAITINPNFSMLYSNRGALYAAIGNSSKAIADLDQAVILDPKNAYAYSWRAIIYAYQGKLDRAMANGDLSITLDPDNADLYANYASSLYIGAQYEMALEKATKAIEINVMLSEAYATRCQVSWSKKNYEIALNDCNKAIGLNPRSPLFYTDRGRIYTSTKQYKMAIQDFEKALELSSNDSFILESYSLFFQSAALDHLKSGDLEQAIYYSSRGISIMPNADLYSMRADAYGGQGMFQKAIENYTKSIELEENYLALMGRGTCYEFTGDVKSAINDYSKSIRLNPDDGLPYYYRGMAYYKSGKYNEGISDLVTAAKKNQKEAQEFLRERSIKW